MQPPSHAPLVALLNATAEFRAGLPPTCLATVRLLDQVYFTVHRGDCVLVRHRDPAEARVLLAALAGHPPVVPHHVPSTMRRCAPGVRIRRGAIRTGVIAPLLRGWREPQGAHPTLSAVCERSVGPAAAQPVVHLLRASRDGDIGRGEALQWDAWARRTRAAGGAVVIVARDEPSASGAAPYVSPSPSSRVRSVSYPPPSRLSSRMGIGEPLAIADPSAVRELVLRHGRLLNLRVWD
jgi:hypothetical protein